MRNQQLAAAFGFFSLILLALTPLQAAPSENGGRVATDVRRGAFRGDAGTFDPLATAATNGISYNGGPVMHGTVHLYFIWYGNWSGNTATTILPDWASHIGGSPYFNINTTYNDAIGSVNNSVIYGGATNDAYSQGTSLTDAKILAIVTSALVSGALPLDPQGVYFVLTSADVAETSGFCSLYCGWHTFDPIRGVNIKYAFIGNGDRCPSGCQGIQGNHPNGNAGADGMASIMTHELDETITDPLLDAWFDPATNAENGDKCNFNFGSTYTTANGSQANIRLGSRDYLLQRNWINAGGGSCQMSYSPGNAFYTLPPCRLLDTRNPNGPAGGPALQPGATRTFAFAGQCGIPATAKALAVNLTVTTPTASGLLTLFPADQAIPTSTVINFSAGATRANNGTLLLSGEGTGSVAVSAGTAGTVHFILDVNGYYQ